MPTARQLDALARHRELRYVKAVIHRPVVRAIVVMLRQKTCPPMDMDTVCRRAAWYVCGLPERVLHLPQPTKPVSLSTIYRDLRASNDRQIDHCHTDAASGTSSFVGQPYT